MSKAEEVLEAIARMVADEAGGKAITIYPEYPDYLITKEIETLHEQMMAASFRMCETHVAVSEAIKKGDPEVIDAAMDADELAMDTFADLRIAFRNAVNENIATETPWIKRPPNPFLVD